MVMLITTLHKIRNGIVYVYLNITFVHRLDFERIYLAVRMGSSHIISLYYFSRLHIWLLPSISRVFSRQLHSGSVIKEGQMAGNFSCTFT